MQVSRVNYIQRENTFKGFERTVYKAGRSALDENIKHRNNTWFFRKDMNWTKFAEFLKNKYKATDKIQTFVYACSDGREAYTLLMALDSVLDEKDVEKFCPIIAKDYDLFAINQAKKDFFEIDDMEKSRINYYTNQRFDEYFEPVSNLENQYRPTKKLTDRVVFETGDFTKEYNTLPKENCILLIRNCWPYFSISNQYALPRKLCEHFEKNATIVIGNFDSETQDPRDFLKNGFKPALGSPYGNVFEK